MYARIRRWWNRTVVPRITAHLHEHEQTFPDVDHVHVSDPDYLEPGASAMATVMKNCYSTYPLLHMTPELRAQMQALYTINYSNVDVLGFDNLRDNNQKSLLMEGFANKTHWEQQTNDIEAMLAAEEKP